MRIAFMGNGIQANMGALYLRKRLPPSAEIVVIGPSDRQGLPHVGESTIEITQHFMEEQLGLGPYLRDNHYPKYALTYYFKLHLDDPRDRTYSVHCNEVAPAGQPPLPGWRGPMARPPAWQLNREVFDRDLRAMVDAKDGIEPIEGLVKGVALDAQSGHKLTIVAPDGEQRSLQADWVIDASGRKQILGKKLGLAVKPEGQRDCFWFRLQDFDRDLLKQLDALGPMPPGPGEPYHYDRYFSTHHFMGHGNWIWLIPMRTADQSELISIGLVSRPDVYRHTVSNMDDFFEHVGKEHPVIVDFVKSGTVVDTNILRKYHYIVNQVYSADRWCIIGDAAYAPDPLFSNGLAFGTIQLEQVGEMIALDCAGEHDAQRIEKLSAGLLGPVLTTQSAITEWYKSMHDPFLSSLRLTWIEITYFYMFLPLVINRCHFDPKRAGLWSILQVRDNDRNAFDLPKSLLDARASFDKATPEHFLYQGKVKVNPRALEVYEKTSALRAQMIEGAELLERYTKAMIERIRELSSQSGS